MPGIIKIILFSLGLTLFLVIAISLWRYPAWFENPIWWLQLPAEASLAVVGISAALTASIWYVRDLATKRPNQAQPIPSPVAALPPLSPAPIFQPSAPSAPHALPAPLGDFTGRKSEIKTLKKQLAGGTRVAISGLAGMGGVGKTALALYAANQLKPQYPDAQIMLELKGTSHEPLAPTEAMTQVIHTFDPTADLRQATPEQIHALYLNALSDKRALLLFDNAVDAAQVKQLIPPTSCAMLVTSRRHFVLPGMDTIRLDMLPGADARKLLLTICPRIRGHADKIAKLCGRLPLALRIAASALAEHIDLSVDEFAATLADRRTRLAKLKSESDPELDLQATFEYSYDLLPDDAKARWQSFLRRSTGVPRSVSGRWTRRRRASCSAISCASVCSTTTRRPSDTACTIS